MKIVGLDIGTSTIKAVLFRLGRTAEVLGVSSLPHPLEVPQAGRAEQDPDEALRLAREVLHGLDWEGVHAVGVSSAMHSLMALDQDDRPLTAAWTWADLRSTEECAELRCLDPAMVERTGTPLHPMAWPSKLLWMERHLPEVYKQAALFVGLKEYVVAALTTAPPVMDRSMASATGCYTFAGQWETSRCPNVVDTTSRIGRLQVGKLPDVPVIAGAGDGPLSNLGSGAVEPHQAALSIGTSGAVRVVCQGPQPDPTGRTFCYHLADDWWVRGGAVSNGTLALDWLRENLRGAHNNRDLVEEACALQNPDGLLFLPYLAGERAPHWDPSARAVFCGLALHHRPVHLARAVCEGIAFALKEVFQELGCSEVRASGGLTASDSWMQLLSNVLEVPVTTVVSPEAAALGAALLAARTLGLDEQPELPVQKVYEPQPDARLRDCFARYTTLYPALFR